MNSLDSIFQKRHQKSLINVHQMAGGDINEVLLLTFQDKDMWVVKKNSAIRLPAMFAREQEGLKALKMAGIFVPRVIDQFTDSHWQYLILEYLSETNPNNNHWIHLAENLAKLHAKEQAYFGFETDNYIGSLDQINTRSDNWIDFFINCRLEPLLIKALQNKLISNSILQSFEDFYALLPEIFPNTMPSLLHGDFWSGNILPCTDGKTYLIDPAVYYGNREMDIAMTQLFGGFSPIFLSFYQEIFPMEKNWQERLEICNLYPRLVHLNLFGMSYLPGIQAVLKKYVT